MKKFKIGQIGIGHNHAAGHMEAFRLHPDLFEIIGYSENSEYWIKKRGDLPCYQDIARLNEDELIEKCDALLIETEVPDLRRHKNALIIINIFISINPRVKT